MYADKDPLNTFLDVFGIEDATELQPDHSSDKTRFFERSAAAVVHNHDAHEKSRQRQQERHLADRTKYEKATAVVVSGTANEPISATAGEETAVVKKIARTKPARSRQTRASVRVDIPVMQAQICLGNKQLVLIIFLASIAEADHFKASWKGQDNGLP